MKRTPLKRNKPLKSKRKSTRPAPRSPGNDFPEEARQAMRRRSKGICEVGSQNCNGKASQFHHRKLRRHRDQRECNGLHACDPCHVLIHAKVGLSQAMGWLVPSWLDPAMVPVKQGERYREFHTQH